MTEETQKERSKRMMEACHGDYSVVRLHEKHYGWGVVDSDNVCIAKFKQRHHANGFSSHMNGHLKIARDWFDLYEGINKMNPVQNFILATYGDPDKW